MNRTDYPKYASYFGDGKGRDKYIILNNGGLAQQNKNYFIREAHRFVNCDTSPKPQKEAVTFKYFSDGSGRDSYVL